MRRKFLVEWYPYAAADAHLPHRQVPVGMHQLLKMWSRPERNLAIIASNFGAGLVF